MKWRKKINTLRVGNLRERENERENKKAKIVIHKVVREENRNLENALTWSLKGNIKNYGLHQKYRFVGNALARKTHFKKEEKRQINNFSSPSKQEVGSKKKKKNASGKKWRWEKLKCYQKSESTFNITKYQILINSPKVSEIFQIVNKI